MNAMRIGFALIALLVSQFAAAAYPENPIKIIVPYSAGSADAAARIVAQEITKETGKTVIVENKTGAGGRIGLEMAAKSPADGYTFVITDASFTLLPSLFQNLPFQMNDLAPVTLVLHMPFVVTVSPQTKISSVAQLIAFAKEHPGQLNYGSAGIGSTNQVIAELFKKDAGVDITHVPYRSMGDAMTAMMGGQVDMLISTIAVAGSYVRGGKAVGIMVPSTARSQALPDVPTAAEAGLPSFIVTNWLGLLAPRDTPPTAIEWMQKAVARAVASPEVKASFATLGVEGSGMPSADFGKLLRSEEQRWGDVVRSANIKAE
jgi:tripartite-type tricarboxylate transporter receptor subunit TctC